MHVTPKQTSCYVLTILRKLLHFKNAIFNVRFLCFDFNQLGAFIIIFVAISHFHVTAFPFCLALILLFLIPEAISLFWISCGKIFQVNTQEAWVKMKIKYNKYIVQNYFNIIHKFDVCEIRKYITDCYNFNTCACNHCKGINVIYIYSCSVRIIMENILWRLLVSHV